MIVGNAIMKQNMMEEITKKEHKNKKIFFNRLFNIINSFILILLILIAVMLSYQSIFIPNKIPNIFGYKLFMIIDENMEDSLKYGDLTFTRNVNSDELKVGDVVAFRNAANTVTIHKIEKINESEENIKVFSMVANDNESNDMKIVNEELIEGILTIKIPKVGLWIMIFQEPIVTFFVIFVILIMGGIAYLIAGKLDERDRKIHQSINQDRTEKLRYN